MKIVAEKNVVEMVLEQLDLERTHEEADEWFFPLNKEMSLIMRLEDAQDELIIRLKKSSPKVRWAERLK